MLRPEPREPFLIVQHTLCLSKRSITHGFSSSVHAYVDHLSVAEALHRTTPLAAVRIEIHDGIENLQLLQADIAAFPVCGVQKSIQAGVVSENGKNRTPGWLQRP